MKWTTSKTITLPRSTCMQTTAVMCALLMSAFSVHAATIPQTLCVREIDKIMSDGIPVKFWGYTANCTMGSVGELPGPLVEVGVGDTLNLTLNVMMAPMEPAPFMGHTIHMHGADVIDKEDGVPETNGNAVMGDIYTWIPTDKMAGSYMYHCHVHTVKHLEMGMYGPMIVRPINAQSTGPTDRFLNRLTPDAATAYDYIQTYLFSTVDPAYHTAVGDDPVFADYNPKYFLLNGKESIAIDGNGAKVEVAAATLPAATGKKVALRLIGLHAVNGIFSIRDGLSDAAKFIEFTVYVQDGRQYPTPEKHTSLDIGPGQRFDIIFTTPADSSGTWYPQLEYQTLRDKSPYANAKVFGSVTF